MLVFIFENQLILRWSQWLMDKILKKIVAHPSTRKSAFQVKLHFLLTTILMLSSEKRSKKVLESKSQLLTKPRWLGSCQCDYFILIVSIWVVSQCIIDNARKWNGHAKLKGKHHFDWCCQNLITAKSQKKKTTRKIVTGK